MKPVKLMIVAALWVGAVACSLWWVAARGLWLHFSGLQGKLGLALLLFIVFGWLIPLAWGLRLLLKRE